MTDYTDLIRLLRDEPVTISEAMRQRWSAATVIEALLTERDEARAQYASVVAEFAIPTPLKGVLNEYALGEWKIECERLRSERDAALVDAQRYRWLRGSMSVPRHSSRWSRWEVRYWNGTVWDTMFCERMDAAIDAAMGEDGNGIR